MPYMAAIAGLCLVVACGHGIVKTRKTRREREARFSRAQARARERARLME
ncbi:hypothetical protein ACFONG_08180 [Uliginosibacterium paludis]|uniref:Uncharacterized protein n=1 Tax=Uliginosibacterium paludis TaxID=1615952 RepID=A0ABV2CKG9_9RHOO